MLKITGIKLEKINDIGMYLFLEKGMRGEFWGFLKDIVKVMKILILCTEVQIIYMDGQCDVIIYHIVVLNG